VHYVFNNGKDTQINKAPILPSASFNLAAELRHGPTLLAPIVGGAVLYESSTNKVFLEFREGLTGGFTRRADTGFAS